MTKRKPPEQHQKRGRPPGDAFTQEIADEICSRLSKGETLVDICKDEWMPATRTVYLWKDVHPEFDTQFVRAREIGFDLIANDCVSIADNTTPDADVQRDRLRVETRLKLLAKWDPRRYGDKQQVEHSGSMTLEQLVVGSQKAEDQK